MIGLPRRFPPRSWAGLGACVECLGVPKRQPQQKGTKPRGTALTRWDLWLRACGQQGPGVTAPPPGLRLGAPREKLKSKQGVKTGGH